MVHRFENMQNDNWNAEEHLVTEFVEKVERTLPSRNDINSFIKKSVIYDVGLKLRLACT